MHKRTIKLAAILLATSFLTSCGGSQEAETAIAEEENIAEETIESDIDEIDYILPSPLQIAELFKNAGLTYVGDLTNSHENVNTYNSKYDQKLNYGIYAADMAYCIMNNQTQESINSLATLKNLSEKIWMTDVMGSMGLTKRLEANVGNEDSLTYIMADLQMQMDNYLEENGMSYTGSIIFTGAWIETMYLGAKVNESLANPKLISRLSEQAVILENLMAAIKQNDNDNEFSDLLADLEKINSHFPGVNDQSDIAFTLSDEAIKGLTADLTELRTKIIGE
jgi:hypothetical protein